MPDAAPTAWERAMTALALLAVDPAGLGGIVLRARAGPVRDAALARLGLLPGPLVRVPATVAADRLDPGLDVAATLATGRATMRAGLLEGAGAVLLPSAERLTAGLAARLGQALEAGALCAVALDEGIDDERLPDGLADRIAFRVALEGIAWGETAGASPAPEIVAAARARLCAVRCDPARIAQVVACADRLGVASPRAAGFALRAARAHAALRGRDEVADEDVVAGLDLALAHRATRMPDPPEAEEAPEDRDAADRDGTAGGGGGAPEDVLLEAVRARLPPGLLEALAAGAAPRGRGAGAGARRTGNRRGRPLPSRPGRPDGAARIDVIATLRAAAPWQTIRAAAATRPARVHVRAADLHSHRYEARSDRLLIFAVDASGSAAFARLAEAKGAVELLLGEAYARRDHVALIAFRGTGAEVLLPPTRSLVQTKRRLASLPGGGGTPLAAGLDRAATLAVQARARGMTPAVALLTDGRANVARDGAADRALAMEDARAAARALAGLGVDVLVLDVGTRPEPELAALARIAGGAYLPLPRADARRLSGAVAAALGA